MKAYCNFFLQASYNYNRHAYIIVAHFAKRWQSTVSYCKQGRMKSYPYEWLLKDADTCVASFAYQDASEISDERVRCTQQDDVSVAFFPLNSQRWQQ